VWPKLLSSDSGPRLSAAQTERSFALPLGGLHSQAPPNLSRCRSMNGSSVSKPDPLDSPARHCPHEHSARSLLPRRPGPSQTLAPGRRSVLAALAPPRDLAADQFGRQLHRAVVRDGMDDSDLLVAHAADRAAGRRDPGPSLHHLARLWAWQFLRVAPSESLLGPRDGPADLRALRAVAKEPRDASWHDGQSRSPRCRRCLDDDGRRIRGRRLVEAHDLSHRP
jgi:hypothetical protein